MQLKTDRAKSNSSKAGTQIFVVVLMVVVVVVIFGIEMFFSTKQAATIDVLAFGSNVYKDTEITEELFTKVTMLRSEYEKAGEITVNGDTKRQIVLWDDRGTLINGDAVYAQYYTPANTPVFWYGIGTQTTTKNSYLYSMDGELLKLNISGDEFGDFIVPGDKINVRYTYTETEYYLPTIDEYKATLAILGSDTETNAVSVTKTDMLFSNATILDMLNGNGSSIYDVWYKWLALPTNEQKTALSNESFKALTAPSTILMCVTSEEVERYMDIQSKGGSYTITLLPRESSNVILEALDSLNYSY